MLINEGARVLCDKHLAMVDLYDGFSKRCSRKIKRIDKSMIPSPLGELCVLVAGDKSFKLYYLVRFILLSDTKINVIGYLIHLGRRLLNFIDPRVKGVIVSMIGVDGAGKSSILNEIDRKLNRGFFPINIFYAGLKSTIF